MLEEFVNNLNLNKMLNTCLLQFKEVERGVEVCLRNSSRRPSQQSLEMLNKLRINVKNFLDHVETFYHNAEVEIKTIRENASFLEILKSAQTLQKLFEDLDDAEIPRLLQEATKKTPHQALASQEQVLCSILGLRDEVAEYLRNIDPEFRYHQTNQEWIKDYFEARNKELSEEQTQEEQYISVWYGWNEYCSYIALTFAFCFC